jgi:hypothetical protein
MIFKNLGNRVIEYQLHDLNNKLMLTILHVHKLKSEHSSIDFEPLILNLERVKDLISHTYQIINKTEFHNIEMIKVDDFQLHLENELRNLNTMYPLNIKYELRDIKFPNNFSALIEKKLLKQILENIFDNSYKFEANLMIARLILVQNNIVFELIDDGKELTTKKPNLSSIPNGIGTKLMQNYAQEMDCKMTWRKRLDRSGMIVSMCFTSVSLD